MRGDVVVLLDVKESPSEPRGRDLRSGEEPESASGNPLFWDSAFFCRYLPVKPPSPSGPMTRAQRQRFGVGRSRR